MREVKFLFGRNWGASQDTSSCMNSLIDDHLVLTSFPYSHAAYLLALA